MKTILYFQSSLNASNNSVLGGVSRYARSANWRVHVAPYADAAYLRGDHAVGSGAPDVKGLLEFWKPDGVIAECGAAQTLLRPCDFRSAPVVFVDRIQTGNEVSISSDARSIAELAARELLSLGFKT